VLEKCSKAVDLKEKKFSLDDSLDVQFDRLGIQKATQEEFTKRGILTIRQFSACGADKILAKFAKPKFKISFQDKVLMTMASDIISHRIEEKEILV